MARQIYVNLPVQDLNASVKFFTQLGFSFNSQYSNEVAACMVVAENISVMLLTKPFFQGFTPKPIADAHQTTEVLVCLSCDSDEEVDQLVIKAVEAGGTSYKEAQDQDFMYIHGFQDLDGHIWELVHMRSA